MTEQTGEGTDTVNSSITFDLATKGANVEKLVLTGTAAINATGNSLANTITGNNAANVIDGGTGTDVLIGGTGNDIYKVDNTGDVVTETSTLATEIDKIISTVSYVLSSNVEQLDLSTATAAVNGTGNSLANTITAMGLQTPLMVALATTY